MFESAVQRTGNQSVDNLQPCEQGSYAEEKCDGLYEAGNAFCPALPMTGQSPRIYPS